MNEAVGAVLSVLVVETTSMAETLGLFVTWSKSISRVESDGVTVKLFMTPVSCPTSAWMS